MNRLTIILACLLISAAPALAQQSPLVIPLVAPDPPLEGSPLEAAPLEPSPLLPRRLEVAAETEPTPVVVELFTSQGCNSCPPADAYLGELAKRKDVLALSYHVDYWDYIGWKDRYADPAYTNRQRSYAKTLGDGMVYTPQIVVAGASDAVGSNRGTVEWAIKDAKTRLKMQALKIERDPASGEVVLQLPEADLPVPATLWLVTYHYRNEDAVKAGENRGRKLVSYNTVRSLQKVGVWGGHAATIPLKLSPKAKANNPDGCAIIANLADYGPVIAAVAFDFDDAW